MLETSEIRFEATPCIVENGNHPMQGCRLCGPTDRPPNTQLVLRRQGEEFTWSGDELDRNLLVPEVSQPVAGTVELTGTGVRWTAEVTFEPVRRWKIFLVNHSHTDIGFTHPYLECIDIHNKNLLLALEMIEATDDWPGESRMRWTVESAWQLQQFEREFPEDMPLVASAARSGLIEVEALYIHSYFDILSREQLTRSLYFAEELRRRHDIPITSAMICDVPGCSWSLVDLLAQSGVRYLAMAPNNFIAPFHAQTTLERPFYWKGPGDERVLVWYTADPHWAYIEGAQVGFWDSLAAVEEKLPSHLSKLERTGYPYDAVQFQLGSDNRPLRLLPAAIAREWNSKYLSPTIEIATTTQFFEHMESKYADQFPVCSGEWQSSWSETSLHYPHEAAESRRNHHTLSEWERFATVAAWMNESYIPPINEMNRAYDASLLFDEHGGPKGIWLPRSDEEALAAVVQGYDLFEAATKPARTGRDAALRAATGAQRTESDPVAVVWNLCPWPRSGDVVIEDSTIDGRQCAVDEASGRPVPFERGSDDCARLYVSEVPAYGFRRVMLKDSPCEAPDWPVASPTIHSRDDQVELTHDRFSMTIDESGVVHSLIDRTSNKELVDSESWPGANSLVRYRTDPHGPGLGGDFHSDSRLYEGIPIPGKTIETTQTEASAITSRPEPGSAIVETESTIDSTYRLKCQIRLDPDFIEIRNRIEWLQMPDEPELPYIVFPFDLPDPEIRHQSQFTIVDPVRQTLPGSNHDTFAIQEWTDLWSDGVGVTVSSDDLPLVDYGGINMRQFHRAVPNTSATLAFRAAALHGSPPERGSPWGKRPYLETRFAIRPYSGDFDPIAANRFGEERVSPLVARMLPPRHPGEWKVSNASFISLDSTSTLVTGIKPANDGRGSIVRLWESAGERSIARLSFPQHELLSAWRTTPTEHDESRLATADGHILLELQPFENVSLRCVLGR